MVDLLVDMFIADQSLEVKPDLLVQKDSMMVYPSIMQKHGVSVEQFEASMRHYVDDGESYLEILGEVKKVLDAEVKRVSELIKKEVEERESRTLTEWWAVDSIRCMPAVDLKYDSYLRAVRWLVIGERKLGDWKFTDSLDTDIPQNSGWWLDNMFPQSRSFVDHFLKDIHKKVESPEETIGTDEIKLIKINKKDEKTGRKLRNDSKRKHSVNKEGIRPVELGK